MRATIQEGFAYPTIYRVPVKNTHSESVPPYGVMQIINATEVLVEDTQYSITKPNGATTAKYLLNGPTEILPQELGFGTDEYPSDAAYNASSSQPQNGTLWGPKADFWGLHPEGTGFLILGGANTDEHLVRVAFFAGAATQSVTSKYAIVTSPAGPSMYTANGITGGTVGRCALLDADRQKISQDSIDEIEFKSHHFVAVPLLAIIELSADVEIVLGSTWDGAGDTPLVKAWGAIEASPLELAQLPGFNEMKVLAMPEGVTDPKLMTWLGEECPEESSSSG